MKSINLPLSLPLLLLSQSAFADTQLSDGVPFIIDNSANEVQTFTITLPQTKQRLSIVINGDNGNADLIITQRNGAQVDCESEMHGSNESCVIKNPAAGTYTFDIQTIAPFDQLSVLASTTAHLVDYQCMNMANNTVVKLQNPALSQSQQDSICQTLSEAEQLFFDKTQAQLPVPEDINDQVSVNIYANRAAFMTTGQHVHNMRDDAGTGIYFETNPTSSTASAEVITFEARQWAQHQFFIWELGHEYVHYLDGRYNKQGTFSTTRAHHLDWWTEGLAEYIADHQHPYLSVKLAQKAQRFTLQEIIESGYDGDASPYDWGATVVKYMFEQTPNDVQTLRTMARGGQYSQLDQWLNDWAAANQANFDLWLDTTLLEEFSQSAKPLVLEQPQTITSQHGQLFYIDIDNDLPALSFQTTLGGGNADLYIAKDTVPNPFSQENVLCSSNKGKVNGGKSDEVCPLSDVTPGRYYALVNAPGNDIYVNVALSAVDSLLDRHDEGRYCQEEQIYDGKASQNADVSLLNETEQSIEIFWLNHLTGMRSDNSYITLSPGDSWEANWSLGDKFVAVDLDGNCQAVGTLSETSNQLAINGDGIYTLSSDESEGDDSTSDNGEESPTTESPSNDSKSSGGTMLFSTVLLLLGLYRRKFR
ncbi:collagenase [Thalassotalea ganghwensis]